MVGGWSVWRAMAALGLMLGGGGAVVAGTVAAGTVADVAVPGTGWRLTATQGAEEPDAFYDGEKVPGAIALCLGKGHGCQPVLPQLLQVPMGKDMFDQPHFLNDARLVSPRGGLPVLFIQVSSLHSGDGDQRVGAAAMAYDAKADGFVTAYRWQTGRNNNQEIRYMATGPLRGAIISVDPTGDAPFGFWVRVNRLGAGLRYAQVLKFRSATHYGDGNPLAVIDSEMPGILQRLGLWHRGMALPVPAKGCARPHLQAGALWC